MGQALLQAPQWLGCPAVSMHAVPHSVSPETQPLELQDPAEHTWPVEQACPHVPQLVASDATQAPPQSRPPAQLQTPLRQT